MTSAEMLDELKRQLGNTNFGYSDNQLYKALTAAQKWLSERTWLTYRGSVGVKTTAADETIVLAAAKLDLTTDCTVLAVKACTYEDNPRMKRRDLKWIKRKRNSFISSGRDPMVFCFRRPGNVPTLDLWGSVPSTNTDFDTSLLRLDILEKMTDINADTDPILQEYAHEGTAMKAAHELFRIRGDDRRFDLMSRDSRRPSDFDREFYNIKSRSHEESSGNVTIARSIIK